MVVAAASSTLPLLVVGCWLPSLPWSRALVRGCCGGKVKVGSGRFGGMFGVGSGKWVGCVLVMEAYDFSVGGYMGGCGGCCGWCW